MIPVILRPVYWQIPSLQKLQALPLDAKPVVGSSWHYQDEAFLNVIEGLRTVALQIMASLPPSSQTLLIEQLKSESTEIPANVSQQQTRKSEPVVPLEDFPWQCIRTLSGHHGYAWSIAISPDGQTLASGSSDETIKLWNLKTGELLRTWKTGLLHNVTGYLGRVNNVAISPDGQTLVSGSFDKTIKLWNLKTGELLRTLSGHEGRVENVAISPDGQTLASGSSDKTIKLWEKK